jgi:hypothetical protein
MTSRGIRITRAVTVGIILLIACYDATALALWGAQATISQAVGIEGSFDSPFIPFAMGIVMGHLFWPQSKSKRSEQ